jgi:anti-sigma-K factor RskA
MNGRIIKFEGSVHAEADRLLPWYVNGTLEESERLQLEQHLAECVQCQREVAWLRTLQEHFAEQAQKDAKSSTGRRPRRRAETRGSAWPVSSAWKRRGRWLAWVAAMQAVVILALGVIVFQQRAPYRTLSAPEDKGSLLVVAFDPRTSEAQMRQLVRDQNARIVGGPTEGGAYVLRVPERREAATRKALLASQQVTLVEYLGSGGNP